MKRIHTLLRRESDFIEGENACYVTQIDVVAFQPSARPSLANLY